MVLRRHGSLIVAVLWASVAGCRTTERTVAINWPLTSDIEHETVDRPPTDAERLQEIADELADNPDTDEAAHLHYLAGRLCERMERLADAQVEFARVVELIGAGRDPAPHYWLGRVLARRGDFARALAELEVAVGVVEADEQIYIVNPHYREAYYLIGTLHRIQGDEDRMLDAFARFLHYGGERERIYRYLPQLERRGQLE